MCWRRRGGGREASHHPGCRAATPCAARELVGCVVAACQGNPGLAIGNVMGSNLANIGLILGLTSLIHPLEVKHRVVWREMPIMLLVTLILYPMVYDGTLGLTDGLILFLVLLAYLLFVFGSEHREETKTPNGHEESLKASGGATSVLRLKDIRLVVLGSLLLVAGGYCIVRSVVAAGNDALCILNDDDRVLHG